jgi:hypothetical protein
MNTVSLMDLSSRLFRLDFISAMNINPTFPFEASTFWHYR